jgi:RNA polymerase sigma factor for flagellar operon FliA
LGTTADQPPKTGSRRSASKTAPRDDAVPTLASAPSDTLVAPERQDDAAEPRAIETLWSAYDAEPSDEARNRLVEHYQPLVGEIVRRFAWRLPRSVDRGDLDTAANVGLMAAVQGFDRERGVRFESYCELRVKGALLDELRAQDWLPRPWRARLEQHKRVLERLRSAGGRDPSDEDVASAMSMPLDEYRQIFGVGMPGAPIGSMPREDGGEAAATGLDVVPDTHSDAPGEKLTRDEILHLVAQKLTVQEYRIVYLKYWEDLSMREIGELMSLSESRVCKIHLRLIERLQDRFRAHAEGG